MQFNMLINMLRLYRTFLRVKSVTDLATDDATLRSLMGLSMNHNGAFQCAIRAGNVA